ncbi:MAG TPA: hypothetical protein VKU00_33085 [Chthonomonadaceae bacterium]|nr:hypothetical protein [Chthonomonadaceae bacterium]
MIRGTWLVLAIGGLFCVPMAMGGQKREEGSMMYAHWQHGPPADPNYFPIAVWLQSPSNAAKFKAAGINLFVGLWEGPTEDQLATLKAAGMPVICEQNAVGLAHKDDPTIVGWMHGDEPDNAQPVKDPVTGKEGYGPCVPPTRIVSDYQRLQATDPTRPIMLNLGQGVANDEWVGRGSGAKLEDYETYVKGGDIVSFDVYPVAGLDKKNGEDYLWYVPKGVDRLVKWTGGQKTIWNCIECTQIGSDRKPTPQQVRSEVWMALIHGSKGLIYFVHQFKPKFNEHALLDDPEMLKEVTEVNGQIRTLAPVLNSPTLESVVMVQSSNAQVPVDVMVKRQGKALYVFCVGMRNGETKATFTVRSVPKDAHGEVLWDGDRDGEGKGKAVLLSDGKFTDTFKPYEVHIYRLAL